MVTSLFFSEIGNRLLTYFVRLDPQAASLGKELVVTNDWSAADFLKVSKLLKNHKYNIHIEEVPQKELNTFFDGKADLLLRLLENLSIITIRVLRLLRILLFFSTMKSVSVLIVDA